MDISGEHQSELEHDFTKTRLSQDGLALETLRNGRKFHSPVSLVSDRQADSEVLAGDVELANQNRAPDYCGSCYGASPPPNGCCNTCEEVRQAYVRKGWSFNDPQGIEQCRDEGWLDKMKEQNTEGCRMAGKVKVNKVCHFLVSCLKVRS
jgi:hypothetical protein